MKEKEFRKYIKQSYHEDRPKTLYMAVLVLFVIVVAVFIFMSTESSVGRFESTVVIKNHADAATVASQITEGLQATGALLADLDSISGG